LIAESVARFYKVLGWNATFYHAGGARNHRAGMAAAMHAQR
jgi:hypothetical protein